MPATVFADSIFPGAKIITASLSVSNTSGSYSTTVSDDRMTGAMKAIALEIADPSVFNGKITVNATAGQYVFSCPDVAGSTTVVISFLKTADDPTQLTSSEFDVLNNRIGDLTTLTTTAKESAVAAINEVNGKANNIVHPVIAMGAKSVDCNTVLDSCIIRTSGSSTNVPESGNPNGILITFYALDTVVAQIYVYYSGHLYTRCNWYGTWSSWRSASNS